MAHKPQCFGKYEAEAEGETEAAKKARAICEGEEGEEGEQQAIDEPENVDIGQIPAMAIGHAVKAQLGVVLHDHGEQKPDQADSDQEGGEAEPEDGGAKGGDEFSEGRPEPSVQAIGKGHPDQGELHRKEYLGVDFTWTSGK